MKISEAVDRLREYNGRRLRLMEICGTHTAEIRKNGIPSILSDRIGLVTGPGCPVCVTVTGYIDKLISLSMDPQNVIITFGDLIRVPGSSGSLMNAKAEGGDIRYVYSPMDMLSLAEADRERTYIFAAVGFETTAPSYAALLDRALDEGITNIRLLTSLKTMPQVIRTVAADGDIDGFLAPGHVAVITGSKEYEELAEGLRIPFAISGFKGEELIASIYALVRMAETGKTKCINLYPQVVEINGNEMAKKSVAKYFAKGNAAWRGMGILEDSGLYLREEYTGFDAGSMGIYEDTRISGCRCKDVITGKITPAECGSFAKQCTPEHPVGACMVSHEGACFNYYL